MKLSTALLATAATATPLSFPITSTQELATFDDLTSLPLLSQLNPVGTYKGLNWTALDVLQAGVLGINAVLPQSGINVAANGFTNTLLEGGIRINTATVDSFDLQSLYFGCVVNTVETAASVPQACTVAFTGYKDGQTEPVVTVNQQFNPTNAVISEMSKADFERFEFTALDRLDVAVVSSLSGTTLTGLLIDNVAYKTYSRK